MPIAVISRHSPGSRRHHGNSAIAVPPNHVSPPAIRARDFNSPRTLSTRSLPNRSTPPVSAISSATTPELQTGMSSGLMSWNGNPTPS
jgi:hypothetical protein